MEQAKQLKDSDIVEQKVDQEQQWILKWPEYSCGPQL